MTPSEKIIYEILLLAKEMEPGICGDITPDKWEEIYEEIDGVFALYDATEEFRCSGIETDIPCEDSRHYESKSVAQKCSDGSWVGWTCWFGGGKHGEPDSIDWIEYAYDVNVTEEQKMVTVRTFSAS